MGNTSSENENGNELQAVPQSHSPDVNENAACNTPAVPIVQNVEEEPNNEPAAPEEKKEPEKTHRASYKKLSDASSAVKKSVRRELPPIKIRNSMKKLSLYFDKENQVIPTQEDEEKSTEKPHLINEDKRIEKLSLGSEKKMIDESKSKLSIEELPAQESDEPTARMRHQESKTRKLRLSKKIENLPGVYF